MYDIKVVVGDNFTRVYSPYNKDFTSRAKTLSGRWDAADKSWVFDSRDESRVRDLLRAVYGTDGSPAESGDLVTVRVKLSDWETSRRDGPNAEFAGRRIATRPGRDEPVRLSPGVVLIAGKLPGSGGSQQYPEILAGDDVIVEIRDLPRVTLEMHDADDYEIVEPSGGVNVDALRKEREALLARLAEIDALLPESEEA